MNSAITQQPDLAAIAAAIADPRALVGPRLHPTWGPGHQYYQETPETHPEWAARAVAALLADRANSQQWLIWAGQIGMWWRERGRGYTHRIQDAGRYSECVARTLITAPLPGRWPVADVMVPAPPTTDAPAAVGGSDG